MKKIIWMLIAGSLCACSDFLEPKSPSEYVPKSVDALNELLLGEAYPAADRGTSLPLFCLHNALNDDVEMSDENIVYQAASSMENFTPVYSWDPKMFERISSHSPELWSSYYTAILGANAALDYLDDVSGTESEKAYVRAQAYALRAFYYFNLVNLFGEPYGHNKEADGVPLKLISDLTGGYDKRKTVREVYEQIIRDLDDAEKNFLALPKGQQNPKTYRINLPSVQLIRARVCLHMEDMAGAALYAKKVIDEWGYELYDLTSFKPTSNVPYPSYVSLDNPETIWVYGDVSDVVEGVNAGGILANAPKDTATLTLNVSRGLVNSFKEGDLRKEYYLVSEYRSAKHPYVKDHYYPWSKCVIQYNHMTKSTTEFGLSLRLSEAYLILAEAVYKTDEALALKMVNNLRKKRYTGQKYQAVNYTGTELLNFIREERRRELCFEGQRWFDLRRYGMPSFERRWVEGGTVIGSYVIEEEDAAYTLPIPSKVIERNTALEQNKLTTPKTLQ